MGKDIAKSIPFAGTAITALEGLVDVCWSSYKDMAFDARVDAINQIIKEKISTEDDISNIVGKMAIAVTFARENEIMEENLKRPGKVQSGLNFLMDKVD